MSAPLVVNTTDGTCWTRRAVTRGGLALYAPEGVCSCPEFVMATEAELAEHGIAGSADVLPMPVGAPGPLELSEQQIEALVAAGDRVVNDAMHEHLCMCDGWPEKCVSTGNYFMGAWDVSGLDAALPAVLGLWERMRGGELDRLRARVAELEAAPTTVYRAEHPDAGITLGHYGTAAAARKHCEALLRREIPGAARDWIEDDEDRVAELVAAFGEDERSTGYLVTALELASAYDEEADE